MKEREKKERDREGRDTRTQIAALLLPCLGLPFPPRSKAHHTKKREAHQKHLPPHKQPKKLPPQKKKRETIASLSVHACVWNDDDDDDFPFLRLTLALCVPDEKLLIWRGDEGRVAVPVVLAAVVAAPTTDQQPSQAPLV
jgi:hypothetical protein